MTGPDRPRDRAEGRRARDRPVRADRTAVSLEEAFMDLTRDAVEYHGSTTGHDDLGRAA